MTFSPASTALAERSYYSGDVDFDDLASKDADFATICQVSKNKRWMDFQNPEVLQQLTRSLLKCDFGITVQLPDDRLCPPVPVRWNYIRWIQELLDTTSDDYSERYDPNREVVGLDIGVGASCVYPLLACSTRSAWRMAGTDLDQHSLDYAQQNVEANGMNKRIKLALPSTDSPLIPLDAMRLGEPDFVMTNPPFYSSAEDMPKSYINKQKPPSAVCIGAENEMIYPGGDVGFISRMLDESLKLREKVQWYTAMLGKMSSLHQILAKLKQNGITNFAVTCLQAGYRTKRWAVAWSFGDYRPRNDVARHGGLVHAVLPSPTAQTIEVPLMSAQIAGGRVDAAMTELEVKWEWRGSVYTGVVEAKENVWSRASRRKKKFAQKSEDPEAKVVKMKDGGDGDDEVVRLAVKISCSNEKVDVRWLRGNDYVLFVSFCGMLETSLKVKCKVHMNAQKLLK